MVGRVAPRLESVMQELEPDTREALRQELAKWRERVPKLALALRQRTEELQAVRDERDRAWQRNEQLLETTELASRQLAALTSAVATLRTEVEQQQARVRHLEAQLVQAQLQARRTPDPVDDLTQIRGIGPRLAAQLNALGMLTFRQIAMLQSGELDDPLHPLHPHRYRILRDGWIEQAQALAGR
jgi:predicted flap endonuclease-1-like 5' DNA nuclease